MTEETVNRRAANKARTRAALVETVYDLIEREGVDAITAEHVADAAGISRRTFFNYFTSVEHVVACGADDVFDRVRSALEARPEGESAVDAMVEVVGEVFTVDLLAEATRAWRAVEQSPAARRFALEAYSDHVTDLGREWIRVRLDPATADPLRASVLSAILLTTFDVARRAWLDAHEGPIDEPARHGFLATVRRAVENLRPVFDGA